MVYISLMMQVMSIKITCILTLGNIAIIFLSGFIFHILLFTQEEEKALRVSSQKGLLLLFLFLFLFVQYAIFSLMFAGHKQKIIRIGEFIKVLPSFH